MSEPVTIEALRDRLRARLAAANSVRGETECPMCHGTGRTFRAVKAIKHEDVAAVLGASRVTVTNFLNERQGLTFEAGMKLMAWLDAADTDTGGEE